MKDVFVYTPGLISNLETVLSNERLIKYRFAAGGDFETAIRLYLWNVDLSQSMYGPLQGFEVGLRNAISKALEVPYGNDWYENISWDKRELFRIGEASDVLHELGLRVTPAAMVSSLRLGFWVGLFDRHYENDLWRPYLRWVFPNGPKPLRRQDVFSIAHRIRNLRNRIAHYEPIFNRDLAADHELVLQFVSWICTDTGEWLRYHSTFNEAWKSRPD